MQKEQIRIGLPFRAHRMGRIDTYVNDKIRSLGLVRGVVHIQVPEGAMLLTIEYESNLIEDFSRAYDWFEKHIRPEVPEPILKKMPRNELWIPFNMGRLVLGDWQQMAVFSLHRFQGITVELEFRDSEAILGLESIHTTHELQTHDVTDIIERSLMNTSGAHVTMISPDSSVLLYTLRPDYYSDLLRFINLVAPYDRNYLHQHDWDDHVGFMHIRASFIGQILTLPVVNGHLYLDGERLYLTELDRVHRRRDIYFEIWK